MFFVCCCIIFCLVSDLSNSVVLSRNAAQPRLVHSAVVSSVIGLPRVPLLPLPFIQASSSSHDAGYKSHDSVTNTLRLHTTAESRYINFVACFKQQEGAHGHLMFPPFATLYVRHNAVHVSPEWSICAALTPPESLSGSGCVRDVLARGHRVSYKWHLYSEELWKCSVCGRCMHCISASLRTMDTTWICLNFSPLASNSFVILQIDHSEQNIPL